jgi:hypothetical protein
MFPISQNKKQLYEKLIKKKLQPRLGSETNNYVGENIDTELDDKIQRKQKISMVPSLLVSNKESQENTSSDFLKDNVSELFLHKQTYYVYNIKSVLKKDKLNSSDISSKVFICPYRVNTNGLKPFLQYLLYCDTIEEENNQLLYFPFFHSIKGETIQDQCTEFFNGLTNKHFTYTFQGTHNVGDNIYVFIELTNESFDLDTDKLFNSRENNLIFCLMDEIVNSRKVFDLPIHYTVTSLLSNNPEMLYLYSSSGNPYEAPTAVYTGNYYEYSIFNSVFGEKKSISESSVGGNYYYFYDFNTAKKRSLEISKEDYSELDEDEIKRITVPGTGKFTRGGVVRLAIFTGKMKVILNEDTPIFTTPNKKDLWTEQYNSLFIGKVRLENGDFLPDVPITIIESNEQQLPLNFIKTNN